MIVLHFIIAIAYVVLFSILLYGYILFFKWLWRVTLYVRIKYKNFTNRKEPEKCHVVNRHEYFKNGLMVLLDKKKNLALLAILLVLTLTIFVQHLSQNTTDANKHLNAKQYFAVGETANTFKLATLNFLHPDFPLLIPVEWFQKLVYWHGTFLLPKNDDEKYLWQQLWFYNPYTITQTPPWGYSAKPFTPLYNNKHFTETYNGFMTSFEKVMDGNISDQKLFYDVVPRDINSNLEFAIIFQRHQDSLRMSGEAGVIMAREAKYQKQTDNLYRYSKIAQQWWKDEIIPKNIRTLKEQQLTFLEAKLTISTSKLFEHLMLHVTKCDDPLLDEYLQDRMNLNEALTPEYKARFSMMLQTYRSMFFQYLIEKYCQMEFLVSADGKHKNMKRWGYIEDQETNLRIGTGYDLQTNENNTTLAPLFDALTEANTTKVSQELQTKQLNVDVRFFGDKTPLHYAAYHNDLPTIELLLQKGADINAQDKAKKIPLQYAIENYSYEATKYLLEHNSSHKWVTENIRKGRSWDGELCQTAWEYLMTFGQQGVETIKIVELIKLLILHDVDLFKDAQRCKGMGNLHFSVSGAGIQKGNETEAKVEIIKMLLEKGLDYKAKNCFGETPYQNAVQQYSWMHLVFEPYMSVEDKKYFKNTTRR
ncbi:MAG: ankyrin repeat domain-containing protein [Thiovulaceae bacterium]|nr:ankyrin repeat domain-containing protein [Sulfurimonadaceae bacterium]